MAHTDRTTVLALAIKDKIAAAKSSLGLAPETFVAYGDHNNIPGGKAITVTSGTKNRELAGVAGPGGRTLNTMEVVISVFSMVLATEASARLEVDQLSEAVEKLLHSDTTMGGIIIHGYVRDWVPGVVYRETSQFRVVQLHFVGITKTNLSA